MIESSFQLLQDMVDFDLDKIDFLNGATNVYRTEEFIVKQHISTFINGYGLVRLMSTDTYYYRTVKRDELYDKLFDNNGKRIHSALYIRTYVE